MNTFLRSRYLESIVRGAVALQLWDGARDARVRDRLAVVIEREDPLEPEWARDQAPGWADDQDREGRFRFPKRARHLHAVLYGAQLKGRPKRAFEVRVYDSGWRFTPRRLRVPVPANPDPDDAAKPQLRIRRTALYPGPAYDVISGSTGIRGRVTRRDEPVRWSRAVVAAASGAAADAPRAIAHGDDQGEFLLIVPPVAARTLASPLGTFTLPLTVAIPPPLTANQKLAIKADPLADLGIEPMGAAQARAGVSPPVEAPDEAAMGWRFPAGYVQRMQQNITFTAGRIHRVTFAF